MEFEIRACYSWKKVSEIDTLTKRAWILCGRSNVGKSSLLNKLLNKKVSTISKKPGKTRKIDIYELKDYYIVDLPGYGYAKRSKQEREHWKSIITSFIEKNFKYLCCLLLVDAKVGIVELDKKLISYIKGFDIPLFMAVTKCDRIPRPYYQRILNGLFTEVKDLRREHIILTSAKTGYGIKELRRLLASDSCSE